MELALSYSFWPWRFLGLLAPNLFGSPATGDYWGFGVYWEDSIYVGLLTLIMGVHGIARWMRERRGGEVLPADRRGVELRPLRSSRLVLPGKIRQVYSMQSW